MILSCFYQLVKSLSTLDYKETPSDNIKYLPSGKNALVGVKGLKALSDGILLRRSLDQGGIVYFLEDNTYPEWSFSYTITDFNLRFPEEGGVYLWYTDHDQEFGEFRGGNGTFHGLMAGIEFRGASPELVFAFNTGEDFEDKVHENLYRDSFDPDRLKGVKSLTVKIIVTKNNFKIELYNGEKLVYDNLRLVSVQPHVLLGINKRFSITSYYNYTSAEKAFKLTNAQLYKREESTNYDPDKIHSTSITKISNPDDVMHPDKELRHFIASFSHFTDYVKSVLGETNNPKIKFFSNKILEKLDMTNKSIDKMIDKNSNQHINNRVNDMDIRLQNIQKNIIDALHTIKQIEQAKNSHTSFIHYVLLCIGSILVFFLVYKEYQSYIHHAKKH